MTAPTPMPPAARCASCGHDLTGRYCAECGERRLRPDEFSVRRFIRDGVREAFNLQAGLLPTLRALVLRPGTLTLAYMEGRRVRYFGPVKLFLLANLIYFLVQPFTGFSGYNTPLRSHMERQVYSGTWLRSMVEERVQDRVTARADAQLRAEPDLELAVARERAATIEGVLYPTRFNALGSVYARALVALIIPALVGIMWLLHLGRGVPLIKHVVFVTYYHAWALFFIGSVFLLALGSLNRLGFALIEMAGGDPLQVRYESNLGVAWGHVMENGSLLLHVAWIAGGLRRAYGQGLPGALGRALAFTLASVFVVWTYRFLLFWLTYHTV